jgi:hypothetical protein
LVLAILRPGKRTMEVKRNRATHDANTHLTFFAFITNLPPIMDFSPSDPCLNKGYSSPRGKETDGLFLLGNLFVFGSYLEIPSPKLFGFGIWDSGISSL